MTTTWQTRDGLPQETVNSIVQTDDGYLWIGTQDGLARFDGAQFTEFDTSNTPALATDEVDSLLEDSGGDLWIAGGNGVSMMRQGIFHDVTPPAMRAENSPVDCRLDPSRRFWLRVGGVFYRGDAGKLEPVCRIANARPAAWAVDAAGAVWVSDSAGGVDRLDSNGTARFSVGGHGADSVGAIAADPAGHVWIASESGIDEVRDGAVRHVAGSAVVGADSCVVVDGQGEAWALGKGRVSRIAGGGLTPVDDWAGIRVDSISVNPAGDLLCWYGRSSADSNASARALSPNVAIRINRTFVYTGVREGLSGRPLCCYRDAQGDIWIGTDTGLDGIRDRACETFNTQSGLGGSRITTAMVDLAWHVLVAEQDGSVYRYSGDSEHDFRLILRAPKPITSMVETPDGAYLCVVDGTVMQIDGASDGYTRMTGGGTAGSSSSGGLVAKLTPYRFSPAFRQAVGNAEALNSGAQGGLWIAGRGKVATLDHGAVRAYTLPSAGDVIATYVDHSNRFWISTAGALCCVDGGVVRVFGAADNLPPAPVDAIFEDSRNNLWFGTRGGGVVRYANGSFQRITRRDGLPSNIVSQILEDDAGNLWFGCPKEIFRIGVKDINAFVDERTPFQAYHYGSADGNLGGSCLSGTQLSGLYGWVSSIWFPCRFGMVRVEPWANSEDPCPLAWNEVSLNGTSPSTLDAPELPPGDGDAVIKFTALDLKDPEHLQFSYRLFGFDRKWIDAGRIREAVYTNLPPGTYRFDLKCVNVDGGWTANRSFVFTLRPHYYQTWQFKVLSVLVFALVATWYVRFRFRMLHERNRILTDLHAKLESQNEILSASREELEVQNQSLAELQAELEAQNAELVENKSTLEIANQKLQRLASTDGLTGLNNHRTFQEELGRAWTSARASGETLSLLLIDVDHFKLFNDRFGHQAGDQVLMSVGKALRQMAREADVVARYGGEEFGVILPQTDVTAAMTAAERFRRAIEQIGFPNAAISASIGVSTMTVSMTAPGSLVQAADEALYASKRHGRNRVTHAHAIDETAQTPRAA